MAVGLHGESPPSPTAAFGRSQRGIHPKARRSLRRALQNWPPTFVAWRLRMRTKCLYFKDVYSCASRSSAGGADAAHKPLLGADSEEAIHTTPLRHTRPTSTLIAFTCWRIEIMNI